MVSLAHPRSPPSFHETPACATPLPRCAGYTPSGHRVFTFCTCSTVAVTLLQALVPQHGLKPLGSVFAIVLAVLTFVVTTVGALLERVLVLDRCCASRPRGCIVLLASPPFCG